MKLLLLDGGGTKLLATLWVDNKIVASSTYGACNLTLDYELAKTHLHQAIEEFGHEHQLDGVMIAAAGVWSNPALAKDLTASLTKSLQIPVKTISDIQYHYFKYFLQHDGCVINLGTGTSALIYKNNLAHLYFGYGPNFDEPGCGFDIGKKLLAFLAYAEANDNKNILYQQFLADHQLSSIRAHVKKFNTLSNAEVADLAKWMLLLPSNHQLDIELQKIIAASLNPLILWIRKFNFQTIYYIGGIVNHPGVRSLLIKACKDSEFNAESNYTVEDIWNMLSV